MRAAVGRLRDEAQKPRAVVRQIDVARADAVKRRQRVGRRRPHALGRVRHRLRRQRRAEALHAAELPRNRLRRAAQTLRHRRDADAFVALLHQHFQRRAQNLLP